MCGRGILNSHTATQRLAEFNNALQDVQHSLDRGYFHIVAGDGDAASSNLLNAMQRIGVLLTETKQLAEEVRRG